MYEILCNRFERSIRLYKCWLRGRGTEQFFVTSTDHILTHNSFKVVINNNCQVASVSEANDCVLFEILLCIYICPHLMQAGATVAHAWWLQLEQNCIYLCSHAGHSSVVYSTLAFLPQAFHSQSISFCRSRRAPFCCVLAQSAMASCSASVSSADLHSLSMSTNAV